MCLSPRSVSVTGVSTVTQTRTEINRGSAQEPTRCLLIKTASWCFCLPGQGATRQGPQPGTAGRATGLHACTPPSCSGGGRHAGRGWQLSEGPGTQAASRQGTGADRVTGLPRALSVGLAHSRAVPSAHVTAAHKLLRKTHKSEGSVANAPGAAAVTETCFSPQPLPRQQCCNPAGLSPGKLSAGRGRGCRDPPNPGDGLREKKRGDWARVRAWGAGGGGHRVGGAAHDRPACGR